LRPGVERALDTAWFASEKSGKSTYEDNSGNYETLCSGHEHLTSSAHDAGEHIAEHVYHEGH
jgi:hypothetical protein